jgi:Flp pilus assembly protein TadG
MTAATKCGQAVMPRRGRGQALTEFALIFPVLMLMLLGVVDLGRGIYAYNAVSNAAREGGRTAIVNQYAQDVVDRAAAQATALGISTSTAPSACAGGVPTGATGVCVSFVDAGPTTYCSTTLAPGCIAVVTVKYTFNAITPIISNLIGPVAMTSTTKQVIESVCPPPATTSGCPIP